MNDFTEFKPEAREQGRGPDGSPIFSDRRLLMQLLVWTDCPKAEALIPELEKCGFPCVLYRDMNDPRGVGLLTFSEDPGFFTTFLRDFLAGSSFGELEPRPDMTMIGRTYTIGYEQDLEQVLLRRPVERALNPNWPWHVWYPLRRAPDFYRIDPKEQRKILAEHGNIGAAFGNADLGHDIRLACFGLDEEDNDFLIGLLGKELVPLSLLVQTMRGTIQTGEYIEHLGPFFVGHVAWQSLLDLS